MAKILIIEDDDSIRNLVKITLEMGQHIVETASNGMDGIQLIESGISEGNGFDLVLLDIMLPGWNGYEILEKLQDKGITVIFMTAKSAVADRIVGLNLGADDYIVKPFEPLELLARVEAHLRIRNKYSDEKSVVDDIIAFSDIVISSKERTVSKNKKMISLTAKEYDLLLILVKHRNQVMTRDQLLDLVWGYDYFGGTRTVDVHIAQLRQKLDLYEELETVYKIGYKLKDNT